MTATTALPSQGRDGDTPVAFDRLGRGEWRIRDRRFPEDDARTVLGHARRRAGSTQVTLLDHPSEVHRFRDPAEARAWIEHEVAAR